MKFTEDRLYGTLIRRYKRFLADIKLNSGDVVTAHCTNSGSMSSCLKEGAPVVLSKSDNPNRKTKYTWEMIFINNGWVGVNTLLPNKFVFELIQEKRIPQLKGYDGIKREVKVLDSRLDLLLEREGEKCFIEVKNVSLKIGNHARFPDSVTSRGRKHLETLVKIKERGERAVMIYIIQRKDISLFGPAWDIDRNYSKSLLKAYNKGVEIIPLMANIAPQSIELEAEIPIDLSL